MALGAYPEEIAVRGVVVLKEGEIRIKRRDEDGLWMAIVAKKKGELDSLNKIGDTERDEEERRWGVANAIICKSKICCYETRILNKVV